MKICIDGAGAMDGPLSRRIAERAPTSACSRAGRILPPRAQQALRLLTGDPAHVVRPRCADNPAELSVQDLVIISLKAHSIAGVIGARCSHCPARIRGS